MLKSIYINGVSKLEKGKFRMIQVVDELNRFCEENTTYELIISINYKMDTMYRDIMKKRYITFVNEKRNNKRF